MKNKLTKILMLLAFLTTTALAGIWINITISTNDVTLEDLASSYYADASETEVIYNANRDVIGQNRQLRKGMKLQIPVTDKFREQPEHLGWR
ncbi:MAG: Unknown protein [uncultured Sulfurovum sp.]|uniref:LysM domain-containing protein n=1 Tax=uncultured Sulfurovum sp. TaxID=269237 RepID=A0A6S6TPM5_9BACT|nr:MAG: Unknown protein [uncultured Sulfurovum sp.]